MALFELYHHRRRRRHHHHRRRRRHHQQLAEASATLMTIHVCLIGSELDYIPAHNPFISELVLDFSN